MIPFFEEVDVAVTTRDREGRVIEMNEQSHQVNLKSGQSLIGENVPDCHPEPAHSMLVDMMRHQTKHVCTTIKGDKRRLIYQIPWYENGEYAGFMKLSMITPHGMARCVRRMPPEKRA